MPSVTNITAYLFAPLNDLPQLRQRLIKFCREANLKGTILLSQEGINLFVAGGEAEVDQLLDLLHSVPGLEQLKAKVSISDDQPFSRMLVKIKKEIIAFGIEGIDPSRNPSPKLSPNELKQWLDEGRPVTLLDTRNNFEVRLGTFNNAVPIDIDQFRDFPAAVQKLPSDWKQKPIVMFCTGGIRCEKAGPFMQREGFQQVYQLDGGILKYFEDCGGSHYQGDCYVFDKRVGIDPSLAESGNKQCFVCLAPLIPSEQQDPRFVEGESCPYCYKSDAERAAAEFARHQEMIVATTNPLPGSMPADNYRPFKVAADYDGLTMLDFLCRILHHIPRDEWQARCETGRILDRDQRPVGIDHRVSAGDRYFHLQPAYREPDVNANIQLIYEDDALIVVNKPAPLPVHPSGRFNRNTLQSILRTVYAPIHPRPAHRLDANTTGVVIFTRSASIANFVQQEFATGGVEKRYVARVVGQPITEQFVCDAPISTIASVHGSRIIDDEGGLASRTEFQVIERFSDGTTLLEVKPLTGRTNQIRVHLWHLGFPILGDQLYLADHCLGDCQTGELADQPLHLHAARLTITHPMTKNRVTFEAPLPCSFKKV